MPAITTGLSENGGGITHKVWLGYALVQSC